MPDLTAIAQALGAIKAMKDLGEAMIALRDTAAFRERQIEFQGKIIEAQESISAIQQERSLLIERIDELEKQITDLKRWDAEKQRYKLVEVGPGAYAYVITPEAQGSGPEHLICPTCYEHAKKSVLQVMPFSQRTDGDERRCPDCKTVVDVAPNPQWKPSSQRR